VTGYIPRWFSRIQTVTRLNTSPTVHGRESNLRPVDHKSHITKPVSVVAVITVIALAPGHERNQTTVRMLCCGIAPLFVWPPRTDTGQDHSRALQTCIRGPSKDRRRRTGRPRQTWLRTIEDDLRPLNFGLATTRRRALDRSTKNWPQNYKWLQK